MHTGDLERGRLKKRPTLYSTRKNRYQVHAQIGTVKSHFFQSTRDIVTGLYDIDPFESDADRLEIINSFLVGD